MNPKIYSKKQHSIKNSDISQNSLTVLRRLKKAGYEAYLVGGGVRDLLLGKVPKDFDIVTNAHPEDIRGLFRNSRIIGRRFRLVHILFGRDIIEVATFRANEDEAESKHYQKSESGFLVRDNIYGSMDDDAFRRDFTINALYYDAETHEIFDYCNGVESLRAKELTIIGEPRQRFEEDPVRILRAIRFEAKLGFTIDPNLVEPMEQSAHLLRLVSPSRMYDEVIKLFLTGHGAKSFRSLLRYDLFEILVPDTFRALKAKNFPDVSFVTLALANSDARMATGQGNSPYFLYAALLWEAFQASYQEYRDDGATERVALEAAVSRVFKYQREITTFPRYVRELIEELWRFQERLTAPKIRGAERILTHKRFKPAYDFLLLRAASQESDFITERSQYWTKLWEAHEKSLSC